MPFYVGFPSTQAPQEGVGRAAHLCTAFMARHFTTSLPQAAAQGGAEHCCFEFSPGEICDVRVVQVEASEKLGEVLVRAVPVRRDIPRGGKQEALQAVLSREVFDEGLKLLLAGVAGVWGVQDWHLPLLHFDVCP